MSFIDLLRGPDRVSAWTEVEAIELARAPAGAWSAVGVEARLARQGEDALAVSVAAPGRELMRLHLRWRTDLGAHLRYYGDHWERGYGDLAWRTLVPHRHLPWYMLVHDGQVTHGYGVRTQPNAFCCWQVDDRGVSLWIEVASGGRAVALGGRALEACTIVTRRGVAGESAHAAASALARRMCPNARVPALPLYGSNDYYHAYQTSTADDIRRDAALIGELAPDASNRPYQVIDCGWQAHHVTGMEGGPWAPNRIFADMPGLARDIRDRGCKPGIWFRPLLYELDLPESMLLQPRRFKEERGRLLDPTVPDALEHVKRDVRAFTGWGYEIIKHDFSGWDVLGRWGFAMDFQVTDRGWSFADRSKTTAEAFLMLYRALREAAGPTPLIACNAISHLTAGLAELNRIGDDTSGRTWERTRKMGVNSLAFRAHQHGIFYQADADCVGLTTKVPWHYNRQWLDLLARSGTPLFVSVSPAAAGPDQRAALREAFARAAKPQPTIEAIDWLVSASPSHWRAGTDSLRYDWYGEEGVRVMEAG